MTYTIFALAIIAAYLLGSIPFGLIIARAHGKDLRTIGSGNIGATNVTRALGKKWGYFCFTLDVLKGLIPTLATTLLMKNYYTQTNGHSVILLWLWLAVGCAAILGHIFPIYIRFRGGKGVATSFGVALGIWPYYTICACLAAAVWVVVVLIWRYISLASMVASVVFPVVLVTAIAVKANWEFAELWPLLIISALIPVLVILRHQENIKRLIAGTESKVFKH